MPHDLYCKHSPTVGLSRIHSPPNERQKRATCKKIFSSGIGISPIKDTFASLTNKATLSFLSPFWSPFRLDQAKLIPLLTRWGISALKGNIWAPPGDTLGSLSPTSPPQVKTPPFIFSKKEKKRHIPCLGLLLPFPPPPDRRQKQISKRPPCQNCRWPCDSQRESR